MPSNSELTYAWADWSVRFCLPILLDYLGEHPLATNARSLEAIHDGRSAAAAFSEVQQISDAVRDRFGTENEHSSAMVMAALTVAELLEVGAAEGADVGWLLGRARYDASRLAEHAIGLGVRHPDVKLAFAAQPEEPPRPG